ncbi:hypothetical protein HPB49_007722 [Dermacentor silvarum]|nr:hypothetical protein HPB49_007722 [Dermacentor silvarum]
MQARHAKAGFDATRKAVSIDVEYFYAFVSFPPRRTLYENSVVTANEINWTRPGVLLEKMHDLVALHEAKEKKYADGFSAILPEGSKKAKRMRVFPRFKTLQTYSVACYVAFNDTKKDIFYSKASLL